MASEFFFVLAFRTGSFFARERVKDEERKTENYFLLGRECSEENVRFDVILLVTFTLYPPS